MRTTNHAANQEKILAFIREEIQTKGYPPSVREICSAVGFRSPSTVHGYLTRLEEAGLIHRDPTKPRAMTLAEGPSSVPRTAPQTQKVPLVGKVTAGQPILAMENIEDELVVPAEWAGNGTVFALRVEGESMVEAGIFDGDILLVRRAEHRGKRPDRHRDDRGRGHGQAHLLRAGARAPAARKPLYGADLCG